MNSTSPRVGAVSLAMLLVIAASPGASASDRVRTSAAVTLQGSATVTVVNTVVNSAPLHTALLAASIAPAGVVFTTASSTGGSSTPVAGVASGSAAGVGSSDGGVADFGAAGLSATDNGDVAGFIVLGGSVSGTTIDGDAVSINVGDLSGGSAEDSATVPVVIAQYN